MQHSKSAIGVDTWNFAKKFDLASLKSEIDKLDIGKLETTPVDLSKLCNVLKNEVVRETDTCVRLLMLVI